MPEEKREQIPTENNAENTQRTLREQHRIEGAQRTSTVNDFPQAAALGQILKDLNFPADRKAIVQFVEQSNRSERNEILPVIQRIEERQYQNVSEIAEATRLVQR